MLWHWLLKLGFFLLYNQMAWSYEWVAWLVSFGQWSAWRRLALLFLQPGPTLELAYGPGVFFSDMFEAGHRPVGIDLSPYMARLAGRRLRRLRLSMRLGQAKAQALPFPSNHFANVVATFPTEYIFEEETVREIERVLQKPVGRLVVVYEGQLRGPWPFRSLIEWLYVITRQRGFPPAKPVARLAAYHFKVRWETAEQAGAQARLLIADREQSDKAIRR